ncbi:MAG: ATP-binding cassette domain-containing protein [Gammaproteobacteria bacterium]|nr:ATP-binding cassette domain-containing protein [Gammaproteobacteria bacterium]
MAAVPGDVPVAVRTRGLTKYYGAQAVVNELDLDIARGTCVGLLGPNGAGKTTTIRMLTGNLPITAGRAEVLGLDVSTRGSTVRARLGIVPQTDNLDPDFTVEENLRIYASYFGHTLQFDDARMAQLLDFVALDGKRAHKVDALSGGMRRRLSIARALVNDPDLILLDEPTTGLDPQIRHMIWARVRDLLRQGRTILLTTHYIEEAERLCDEVIIMDQGRIVTAGAPRKLVAEYINADVLEVGLPLVDMQELAREIDDVRFEHIGTTTYCYSRQADRIAERLKARGIFSWLLRPANLEDVFFVTTGRDLRD